MQSITKSERFVASKKELWEELKNITLKIRKKGYVSISETEVKQFPRLYRLTCRDLAEADMLELSPDVTSYLNELVGQAHKCLYSIPPLKKSAVGMFFARELPNVLLKNYKTVLLSAAIFYISFLATFFVIKENPDLAGVIVPDEVLNQMESSYKTAMGESRALSMGSMASSYYIQHNVSIAFASFAAGVLLGIGTIYFLLYNGMILGAITGYIFSLGYSKNFISFVTAHSVFELSGLVVAGAAGLLLGSTILSAGRYSRKDSLKVQKNNIFTLVVSCFLLITTAAFIEGFISPSASVPYAVKLLIAIFSLLSILWYFLLFPLKFRNEG